MIEEFRTTFDKFCVSNPLVELITLFLNIGPTIPDPSLLADSIKKINITQLFRTLSSESLKIRNLFGGFTFCHRIQNNFCSNLGVKVDENSRKISGAKALMLPYALKHSTKAEDKLAEVFDIKYMLYQNSKKHSNNHCSSDLKRYNAYKICADDSRNTGSQN